MKILVLLLVLMCSKAYSEEPLLFYGQNEKPLDVLEESLSPEAISREQETKRIIDKNQNRLRYCLERDLTLNSLKFPVRVHFYFTVTEAGNFTNFFAENVENFPSVTLLDCSLNVLRSLKASSSSKHYTFRYKVVFSKSSQP